MVSEQAVDFFNNSDSILWKGIIITGSILFITLLLVTIIYPMVKKQQRNVSVQVHKITGLPTEELLLPIYKNIAVALDFTNRDWQLLAHAMRQAEPHTRIILIHIVESAPAKVLGIQADDFESRDDQEKLNEYVQYLQTKGFIAESRLGFQNRNKEIPNLVKEVNAELLIIGAHGHSGVKDWLYGETIDAVRHRLKIPVLIVNL
jgi:manganese transport protein